VSRAIATATILVAGGGTGGHVFPGLAVADAARALAEDVSVTFVGTARGLEARVIPARGYPLELLSVEPMKGGGVARAARGAVVATAATVRALAIVRRLRPAAVLSVGGYAAGPISLAAAALGVPLAILEPNATMGLANAMLAPLARRAYVAWPSSTRFVRASALRVVGVPLRAGFAPSPYVPVPGRMRVLVLGGSQGAQALNERMPEAIAAAQAELGAAVKIEVLHQAGRDRDEPVRQAYARERLARAATVSAFVEDVAAEIARADVVVARAGAGAVAEIAAVGRAAILVPFPFAADDHQAKNAEALASAGGAIAIRQEAADAFRLGREIALLAADAKRRMHMADAARSAGKPDAARVVAEDLLSLCTAGRPAGQRRAPARSSPPSSSTPSLSTVCEVP
jgi:UDP-N-acetylglucosamine--N-acetylmuramyl-(pentapeptide) pyrophosphoryl-undecaprenol N-acetylglucosamine transferase